MQKLTTLEKKIWKNEPDCNIGWQRKHKMYKADYRTWAMLNKKRHSDEYQLYLKKPQTKVNIQAKRIESVSPTKDATKYI